MDTPLLYNVRNSVHESDMSLVSAKTGSGEAAASAGAGGVINMMPGSAIAKPCTERGGVRSRKHIPSIPHLIFLGS